MTRMSTIEELFALHCRAHKVMTPAREHRFHPTRKWRFDFAWPSAMVAVEIEGGVWTGGRHTRGSGFTADAEKYNEAALLGWRVLRFTGPMVRRGAAIEAIKKALEI